MTDEDSAKVCNSGCGCQNKGGKNMPCKNVKDCICPKTTCPNHGKCCECVIKHRNTDSLPYCLFPDNNGDKSNENHYKVLKKKYENVEI